MAIFGRREERAARTDAEREAARLERERRRAAREGRPIPDAMSEEAQPPGDLQAPAPEDAGAHEPPRSAPGGEEAVAEAPSLTGAEGPEPDGEPALAEEVPEPDPDPEPEPAEEAPEPDVEPAVADEAPAPEPEPAMAEEAPPPDPDLEPALADEAPEPDVEPALADEAPAPEPEPASAEEAPTPDREPAMAAEAPAPAPDPPAADESPAEREEAALAPAAAVIPDPADGEIHAARAVGSNGASDEPDPTQPLEPAVAAPARRTVSLPRPQTEELGHHSESWDRPIGNRRVSRAEYQAQPGAPGMPPYRRVGVPKRRRGLRRLFPLLALLVVVGIAVFGYFLYQPFHGKGYGSVTVRVPTGANAGEIGDLLASKGVVDSSFFFSLRARLAGVRGKLRAGTYHLKQSMPYGDALDALTTAPKAAATIDVTLPEGPSRRELAPIAKRAGVHGSYMRASAHSSHLNPRNFGAPHGTRSLEGFLFPDTYQLRRRGATARKLVADQLHAFKSRFRTVDLSRAKRRHLSAYDVLIIASMIEREAMVAKDRRLISAVIYNRLRQGIPLGIDATLRYRLNNWSRPLRVSELRKNTPYNTRQRKGLPPTPIGNPGLASIRAAAHPANAGYLFYVVKPCGNGAHVFSSTNAQFLKDVAAYNRARKKRGGKDPSRC